MAEIPDLDAEARRQNIILAKVLLRKFNILHEFHVQQLERFTIACCHISLGGEVTVSGDDRVVTYDLKTTKYFKKVGREVLQRSRFSIVGYFTHPEGRYNEELKAAAVNLSSWTRELLWGDETRIRVIVDGRFIQ